MTPVELVLDRLGVKARRQGDRWWADQCPLPEHGDHKSSKTTRSFFIRDDQAADYAGTFWCFSCKTGGSLVGLVMLLRGLEHDAAVEWLASVGERPPPPVLRVRFDARSPTTFRMAPGFEVVPWDDWNPSARRYAERRGITRQQVERWGVGYALEGRLEGRIVFPIRTATHRLANYSARTFVDDPVRYLAASNAEKPDLTAMWGEEGWGSADQVVVCEGVVNGLAIERAVPKGVAVAALQGSTADPRKLAKLARFGLVMIATDADAAGDRVARQLVASLGRPGRNVARAMYPDGKDAAELEPGFLRSILGWSSSNDR